MILSAENLIKGVCHALDHQVSPNIEDDFAKNVARLSRNLLVIVANSMEDAVALRVEENAALRTLFAEASCIVPDDALSGKLKSAAESSDPGLRLSQLDEENDRLRRLLVELQTCVERQTEDAARELDRKIWRTLADIEAVRAPRREMENAPTSTLPEINEG